MRLPRINQAGFEAVTVIVVVLFIAIIGFAGYKVMNLNDPAEPTSSQDSGTTAEPDTIQSQSDLNGTSKSLHASEAQLDRDLQDSSLDSDINTML
jgi:hypothetical protein